MRLIPIRSDNGHDFCQACSYQDSETCDFCDEGDQFEEADHDSLNNKELAFA